MLPITCPAGVGLLPIPTAVPVSAASSYRKFRGNVIRSGKCCAIDLEKAEPRLAQVAQMRYFGGYSEQEIAEALDITERTVQRDWEKARLILAEMLL